MKTARLTRCVLPIPLPSKSPMVAVEITATIDAAPNSTVRADWMRWIQC